MSIHKPQNPILVIATLGVYFGLILAGATPQVLANAAMTRQFDVKDEIELQDGLDTNPDDERSPVTASVQIFLEDVEYFFASLGGLKRKGEFDAVKDTFYYSQNAYLPCADSNIAGSYSPIRFDSTSERARRSLVNLSTGMIYGYSLGDCLPSNSFQSVSATDTRFTYQLDKDVFSINLSVKKDSPQRALELLREIKNTLRLYSTKDNKTRKRIIESTKLRVENDQIFIVTRLPRAGLQPLLAVNTK